MKRHTSITKMVDGVCTMMRTREYSPRSAEAYASWIRRFLRYHDAPHWRELGEEHARDFLRHLQADLRLAPKSRNQAASALAFLYREVLGSDVMDRVERAKEPENEAVYLSHGEALRVVDELTGKYRVMAEIMYGSGLRVSEVARMRVKDVDFDLEQILVRRGKGAKDRFVQLPQRLRHALRLQIRLVRELHRSDRKKGGGWAALPGALHRKDPTAGYELGWQFLFPASRETQDPATGRTGRWHIHRSAVQRQMKRAVRASGIVKDASSHTLRHSYGSYVARTTTIDVLQRLMGHKDVRTTMKYVHNDGGAGVGVKSPLDQPSPFEDED